MLIALLPLKIWSETILQHFTVRVHSRIVEKGRSWARLWYLLRGIDQQGSGFVSLPLSVISELLEAAPSTIRQWLREGKECKAIRWWKCQRGNLRVAIGGLFAVCQNLGLNPAGSDKQRHAPWGVPSEVGLHQILSLAQLRAAATASTAQRLQQLSRFAAWRKLPAQARKTYKLPQPTDFFPGEEAQRLSDNHAKGSIRCVIHIGKRRVWTSRGFIPFGVSQQSIALERGLSDRTVQRHLSSLGIDRRQIVQSKSEYRIAANAISHDAGSVGLSDDFTLYSRGDDYYLSERSGSVGEVHTHKVGTVGFSAIHSRFFRYGKKEKLWLYRCNIYQPTEKLCTMSAAKARFRRERTTKTLRRGDTTFCKSVSNSFEISEEFNAIPAE